MMFAGLDPNFFPASEAAEAMAAGGSSRKLEEQDRRFKDWHSEILYLPEACWRDYFIEEDMHSTQ